MVTHSREGRGAHEGCTIMKADEERHFFGGEKDGESHGRRC